MGRIRSGEGDVYVVRAVDTLVNRQQSNSQQFAIAFHAFDIDSTLRLGIEMDGKALVNSGALYHPQIMGKKLTVKSVTVAKDVVRHFLFSAMTVTGEQLFCSSFINVTYFLQMMKIWHLLMGYPRTLGL